MVGPIPDAETMDQLDSIQLEARAREVRFIKLDVILRLYAVIGLLAAVLALAYFGFSFLKITLTEDQRIALIMAGSGVTVSAMSYSLLIIRRRLSDLRVDNFQTASLDLDLIKEWSRFEAIGRKVLEEKNIEFNSRSPRSILSTLESHELIPSELAREISAALDVRNKVVHNAEPQPQILVEAAARILANSNNKLQRILRAAEPNQTFTSAGFDSGSHALLGLGAASSQVPRSQFASGGEALPVNPARKGRKLNLDEE
ncbi:hypothetical protein M2336_001896 [Sphingobium sp. B1D7B]|uniref:hypothetical protein n=1 Tax=Sphingobium sp. B1D7B TaxID=2940578 RepID=UPI002225B23E|nr:hypothetical protein [Sphingobium sp. B1D7B]MCW2405267.1 hypothetical protein [Sphingobium sp. B1D7B]